MHKQAHTFTLGKTAQVGRHNKGFALGWNYFSSAWQNWDYFVQAGQKFNLWKYEREHIISE